MVPLRHGVRRRAGGGVRVTLTTQERDALRAVPDTLHPVLSGDRSDLARAVRDRLFPRAYDDDELEHEYRSMVSEDLYEQRAKAVAAFDESLDRGRVSGRSWTIDLAPEDAEVWLSVVNDARLTLGTLLGVTDENHWEDGPDRDNPASMLLWYLGWLEEGLVHALTGSLPEG